MAAHGRLSKFDPQKEDWTLYSERLQAYFAANKIEDRDTKKAILLSVVGAETYQLMQSLIAPEKPAAKDFDAPVKLAQDHSLPANSVSDCTEFQIQLSHSEVRQVLSHFCC